MTKIYCWFLLTGSVLLWRMSSCVVAVCVYVAAMELAWLYGYNSHITLSSAFTLTINIRQRAQCRVIKQ